MNKRPIVMPALVVVNVAVFVVMLVAHVHPLKPTVESLIRWGANYGPRTTSGQWWRLLTCMFLHIGVIHLIMNMIVLWDLGRLIERVCGRSGFLVVYLIAGLAGSITSVAWNPQVVSAGASGAVFGLAGVLVALLVRHRALLAPEAVSRLQKSAGTFIGLNVVYGLSATGIDMAAHVGGLVAGFVCALPLVRAPGALNVPGAGRRAALVAVAGLVVVTGAAAALPRSIDVEAEWDRFAAVETKALDVYNGAIAKVKEGELSNPEFARLLDEQVLPEWQTTRAHLAALKGVPKEQQKVLDTLVRYMAAREEGWALFAAALRTGDEATHERSRDKQKEAEELLGGMNRK